MRLNEAFDIILLEVHSFIHAFMLFLPTQHRLLVSLIHSGYFSRHSIDC